MRIKELQVESYRIAFDSGFHKGEPNVWKFLGNLHAEVSEAWEEARIPGCDFKAIRYRDDGKPEGFAVELADLMIRIADTAETFGIDLEAVIREKAAFNKTRPFRHRNKQA